MKAEITVGPLSGNGSSVTLDGLDVSGSIRGFMLYAEVGELTRLRLEPAVMLRNGATVTAEVPDVYIPDETAELLKQLGWTPPGAPPALPDVGADPPVER